MISPPDGADQRGEALRLQDPDPDRVVQAAFARVARLARIDLGFVFLPAEAVSLWPRWHWGVDHDDLEELPPLEVDAASVAGRCVLTGRTQIVSAEPEEPGWHEDWARAFPVEEGVAVPLFVDQSPRGAFLVGWFKPFQIDDHAVAVVEGVAYQVAAALQHSEQAMRTERSRLHLAQVVEALPVAVVVIDGPPHRITRVNGEGRLIFGEVDGREVCEVVAERRFRSLGGKELEPEQVACALALSGWKEGFRIRMTAVDGTERIMAVSVVPEVEGSTLVAFRDTTSEFGFEEKRARYVETAVEELGRPLRELKAFCQLLLSRFGEGREPLAAETTEALAAVVDRLTEHATVLGKVAALHPVHPSELRIEVAADLVRAAWEATGGRRADVRVGDGSEAGVLCAPRLVVQALREVLGSFREAGARWVEVEVSTRPGPIEIVGRTLPYDPDGLPDPTGAELRVGMARACLEATRGALDVDRGTGSFSLRLPAPLGERG